MLKAEDFGVSLMDAAMKNVSRAVKEDHKFELPPGFRFHPTDEELITQYLSQKVLDSCFSAMAIGEVDLNKCEPWDLPWIAKMGEEEWYFFCVKDRKYPTGLRTNRATEAGYWKATGKDREIYKEKVLIGMKKTLVFYMGRAPKGQKTNWVMHEYRLEGKHSKYNLPNPAKNEWVICRVFQKSSCGKKMHIPEFERLSSLGKEPPTSLLPPLMDSSPYNSETKNTAGELSHVTCFSDPNQREDQKPQGDIVDSLETPILASSSSSKPSGVSLVAWSFPKVTPTAPHQSSEIAQQFGNSQCPDDFLTQEQSMLRMLIENHGSSTKPNQKAEFSQERDFDADISSVIYNNEIFNRSFVNHQELSSPPAGQLGIDYLWNY